MGNNLNVLKEYCDTVQPMHEPQKFDLELYLEEPVPSGVFPYDIV